MSYRYVSDEYDPEPPDLPSPAELALDNREWPESERQWKLVTKKPKKIRPEA